MTQPPDFAAIAARANANGIMVTACGVKEIAGMLAPQSMPQGQDALRKAVEYIERYGLMPAEKRRAARAKLDALAAVPRVDEAARLMHVIDRDRYAVAIVFNNIKKVLAGYGWLSEAGRGPYAYDDDRYQREFGDALLAIEAAMAPLGRLAFDKSDCTTDPQKVADARNAGVERAAALATEVPADPQPCEWRDKIAAIVARAYGGSLYPGLGVPGDYPVADVDYRAADAIIAALLHNGGVAASLEEIVAALTREGRNDEYALTIDHDRLRAAIKAARAALQAPSASGCPDGCAKACQEPGDCAEWQEAMRLRREQAFYGAGHTDSAHWVIWVEATEWAWKFVRANYFV